MSGLKPRCARPRYFDQAYKQRIWKHSQYFEKTEPAVEEWVERSRLSHFVVVVDAMRTIKAASRYGCRMDVSRTSRWMWTQYMPRMRNSQPPPASGEVDTPGRLTAVQQYASKYNPLRRPTSYSQFISREIMRGIYTILVCICRHISPISYCTPSRPMRLRTVM